MKHNLENKEVAVQLSGVKKQYRLGQIGGGTLQKDFQSWWARRRGKEDPNIKIGQEQRLVGETFMALNGIDLTIYKGEAVGIIGGNGAGKSTMLKLLSRVTAPSEGSIDIYGRIASMLEVGTGFNGEMTGRENIYMNGAILGMTKAEIDSKMEDIIEFSEVREFIDTPVKRYSSGMYVKLAFSVAAHLDSEIMIMDEVLAVGDMAFQQKCLNRMRAAAKQEGRTVLYVSHNMNTIRQLCDRCIVLNQGKVEYEGEVEEAIKHYIGMDILTNMPVKYDFTNMKRFYHFGKEVFINELVFKGRKNAIYEIGESIQFEVSLNSKIAIEDAQLILQIKDNSGSLIGISFSDCFNIVVGNEQKFIFEAELTMLTNDKYCLDIEVIKKNETGSYVSYDNPKVAILIELQNEYAHGIRWNKDYWGHVLFPQTKCIS